MNIFFYIIIFAMGITFGSFYTLAVYRIPKKQDITHTHSYCPNCNHKLNFIDLIPIFSYIFLGAKCRYCKEKIRPRYLILETLAGLSFVILAYLLNLNIYNLNLVNILQYSFFILYLTFLILMSGINKEDKSINKSVLNYGVIISVMYIVYLYIIEKTSIYRYVIYLALSFILLVIDYIKTKKEKKCEYINLIIVLMVMVIFTAEYITIMTIITTIFLIIINLLINKNKKTIEKHPIVLFLSIFNIIYLILVLLYFKLC